VGVCLRGRLAAGEGRRESRPKSATREARRGDEEGWGAALLQAQEQAQKRSARADAERWRAQRRAEETECAARGGDAAFSVRRSREERRDAPAQIRQEMEAAADARRDDPRLRKRERLADEARAKKKLFFSKPRESEPYFNTN